MNLVAEYDSDSTDEEEVKPKEKVVLPPADDALQSTTNTSVFTTSFDRKEEEQREVLERHVTMVENKDNITQVNGRKGLLDVQTRALQSRKEMSDVPRQRTPRETTKNPKSRDEPTNQSTSIILMTS
uniref:Uncharacterized protein n=1 Tax=Ciona savignyi TaxID=51511 RepID=H2YKW1_CIOSA